MSPVIKPGTEIFARVVLTIVVLCNAVMPTIALAMPVSNGEESSIQLEPRQNIFPPSSMSAHAEGGFNESVPEIVKDDEFVAQISTSNSTPEQLFTPTPDLLPTQIPALAGNDNQSPLQFDFSASPAQANPGDDVVFTITITNNDKTEITGLTFSNLLPDQLRKPKSENNDFKFDPKTNILTWTADSKKSIAAVILPGESITLQYTATIDSQIDKDLQVVDEANLFIDGVVSPLTATLELGIFSQDKKKEFTALGAQGGKAEGVEGHVSLNIPAGELSETEGILIEDISESFQPNSSAPLLVFQLDVVSQKQENAAPVISTEITTSTPLDATSTVEPLSTATLSRTATPTGTIDVSTPTPESLATNDSALSPEAEQQAQAGTIESVSPDSNNNEEASLESTSETPSDVDLTPTPTITTTPTVEPSPTTVITPTVTLPPTIVVEETPAPILASQELDTISSLKLEEARFDKPVEITVSFDGILDLSELGAEYAPYLVTLDEKSNTWVRIPLKSVDRDNNTITAETTHFSTWGAGIGTGVPQNGASIPLFDSAYPDLFTGGAGYSVPIWTPSGRNGMAPSLSLSYSSKTADGILGDIQAPWVGMGWNIGSVEIVRRITSTTGVCAPPCANVLTYGYQNHFTLLFNGTGYELIPNGTTGRYHTKSESFLYIQLHNESIGNNPSTANTSGEWWEVVEKDGTRWSLGWNGNSEQLAAMKGYPGAGWNSSYAGWGALGYAGKANNVVVMRWRADLVYDTFDNAMAFSYFEEYRQVNGTSVDYDRANYLDTISFTGHTSDGHTMDGTPAAGYSVAFIREVRSGLGDIAPQPIQAFDNWDDQRLDKIEVKYGTTVVRTYDLTYTVGIYNNGNGAADYHTTQLQSVKITGGSINAPDITFDYASKNNRYCTTNCATNLPWPYPRLSNISNGYGGTAAYTYSVDRSNTST